MPAEVIPTLVHESPEAKNVSDSGARMGPSVPVVRGPVDVSGREARVVAGGVVVTVVRRAVVVCSVVPLVRSGLVPTVVGSTVVVVVKGGVVVGREVVVRRVVVGALFSCRRTFLFTSLNQPGTSMRQQYTPLSSSLVLKMVKETSPLWIFPKSLYFDDLGEVTFVPSVWRISWLHLELGHGPLPQHMLLLLRDQDECVQGKVTDLPKTPVWTISDAADAQKCC